MVVNAVISLALAASLFWYLRQFIADASDFSRKQTLAIAIAGGLAAGAVNFFAIGGGWTIWFIAGTAAICVGQYLMLEGKAKLPLFMLVAGQLPAACVAIYGDMMAGTGSLGKWIFQVLALPVIELSVFSLVSFISAENDASQSR